MEVLETIELSKAFLYVREDGIVVQVYKKDTRVDVDYVKILIDQLVRIKKERGEVFLLIDATAVLHVSVDARKMMFSQNMRDIIVRGAVFSSSPVSTIIINIVFKIMGVNDFIKKFSSLSQAEKWLLSLE